MFSPVSTCHTVSRQGITTVELRRRHFNCQHRCLLHLSHPVDGWMAISTSNKSTPKCLTSPPGWWFQVAASLLKRASDPGHVHSRNITPCFSRSPRRHHRPSFAQITGRLAMPAAFAELCGILNLGPVYYPLAKPVCFLAVPEEVTRYLSIW